jgi:hypothetical protein
VVVVNGLKEMTTKRVEVPEFEELKTITKNYQVTTIDELSSNHVLSFLQRKYHWFMEETSISSLKEKQKERLFIYFILYYGISRPDYRIEYAFENLITIPRCYPILPAVALNPSRTDLTFLYLRHPSIQNEQTSRKKHKTTSAPSIASKTLKETIEEGRRITLSNILRWSQQLLRTILFLHKNYIILEKLDLSNILLESDTEILYEMNCWIQMMHHLKKRFNKIKEDEIKEIPKTIIPGRQIWVNFYSKMEKEKENETIVESPRKKHEKEESILLDSLHLFTELRNNDVTLGWKLAVKYVFFSEFFSSFNL